MTELIALPQRGILELTGPDTVSFLQGMVSNDVTRVTSSQAQYAALLSPQGKFLHEMILIEHGDAVWLESERDRLADLAKRLTMFRLRAQVEIVDRSEDLAVAAVIGNDAHDSFGLGRARGVAAPLGDGVALVDPRIATLGVRVIAPPQAIDALEIPRGRADAYDRHRLALGVPDGSRDIAVDKALLLEANFEELHGVDFDKGCYVGQENTTRQKRRATVRKRLMPIIIDGPVPAPGTVIMAGARRAGEMRSARDKRGIALLRLDALESSEPLQAGETKLRAERPDWLDG